ncbi:MAG TPA: hydroxymethylbilane synthase, partial [Chromatiales bacterium]|nr:hydroxymethylbilane synthase [Chromatiales bacterium]
MKTGHPLLRLGTRGSLLAVAQSRQVAGMLARARAQTAIELQTITTHGDDDLRTPLDQTDDPGFFSRRIDH